MYWNNFDWSFVYISEDNTVKVFNHYFTSTLWTPNSNKHLTFSWKEIIILPSF